MKLKIYYYEEDVMVKEIDHTKWNRQAPNSILRIEYTNHNGATTELHGYGAYYVIDDHIGGFSPINAVSLADGQSRPTPVDEFVTDKRVKLGIEIPDREWKKFNE